MPWRRWQSSSPRFALVGGLQLLAIARRRRYRWRALDEARARPPYLIEATAGVADAPTSAARDHDQNRGTRSADASLRGSSR